MKKIKTVPKFKSIQEEAEFWDTHSTEDFPEYWQPAPDVKFSKNLVPIFKFKKIVPVRLDGETINAVKKVAKQKGVGTSTAIRMLIRERLSELKVI